MRRWNTAPAALLALFAWSCAEAPTQPEILTHDGAPSRVLTPADGVRISEIHYDNSGTDTGETIELAGPAGTSLEGWSVVLYNGASTSRSTYNTRTLTGTIPNQCSGMGTVVLTYPTDGLQNGSPDGLALVSPSGVVEFLSYEGTFTAANGPAVGMTSEDIGVVEEGTTPVGHSLQRDSRDEWRAPAPNTFAACAT